MKYSEIYELYNSLLHMQDIAGFKVAYAVAKNIRALQEEAEFFENRRINLLKKYGTEFNGRVSIATADKGYADFVKEFEELAGTEVNVQLYKVSAVEDADMQSKTATARDYLMFMQYIVEDGKTDGESDKD